MADTFITKESSLKIYVASPYGRRQGLNDLQLEINAIKSLIVGRQLIRKGHNPYLPLLLHYVHRGWDTPMTETDYHKLGLEWMYECDAILRLNGGSWGADDEVAKAKTAGLKVYYSIAEVPDGI